MDGVLLPEHLFLRTIDVDLYNLIVKEGKQDILVKNTLDALIGGTLLPLDS
jgi:hypothetical protein